MRKQNIITTIFILGFSLIAFITLLRRLDEDNQGFQYLILVLLFVGLGILGVALIRIKKVINSYISLDDDYIIHYDSKRTRRVDFKNISIASIYLPSGTTGDERQNIKYKFMDKYYKILQKQLKQKKNFIIAGDWNIAHQKIDIKNWRSNQKNSGFLPEERAWMDKLFNKLGYIDAFRYKYPNSVSSFLYTRNSSFFSFNDGSFTHWNVLTTKSNPISCR